MKYLQHYKLCLLQRMWLAPPGLLTAYKRKISVFSMILMYRYWSVQLPYCLVAKSIAQLFFFTLTPMLALGCLALKKPISRAPFGQQNTMQKTNFISRLRILGYDWYPLKVWLTSQFYQAVMAINYDCDKPHFKKLMLFELQAVKNVANIVEFRVAKPQQIWSTAKSAAKHAKQ